MYKYNNGIGAVVCDKCDTIIATGYEAELMADEDADEDLCVDCSEYTDNDIERLANEGSLTITRTD